VNPEIVSFQYATGMCLLLENMGGCVHAGRPEVVTEHLRLTSSVQSHPHSPGEDTSLGSAETLVRRGGILNLSNISAKNYRNRFMWVESIVCNISVVFLGHSVEL